MDKKNFNTNFLFEEPTNSRKGKRRSLSLAALRQAKSSSSASTSVDSREKEDSLRGFLPISGRHLGPGWGKIAVAPISYEPEDSQPLTPYQRPSTLDKRTGNQGGVGKGENSIGNPVTPPEGCSSKGIKRARSASPRDESKHHTRSGRRQDLKPSTDPPRSDRMLRVSVYDILQTRTYAHYRAQLSSLLAESGTTKGASERVLSEHPDLPSLSHMISCPWPRDSRNDLVKPGYRTQNMPNDAVGPWPAPSRVENEQSGPSQGHGIVLFPASDNRLITPSSREGGAAARTAPRRSRPADSRITKGSQDGPKGRSKVWKLRADSDEPASEAE